MTNYPAQIDTSQSLPTVVDNLTPVQGIIFNRLRDTVISIETTLGTNPNGVYTTVGSRLYTLENIVGNLQTIALYQDLGGTLANPLVIGLYGYPLSNASPALNNVLTWTGINWSPQPPKGLIDVVLAGDLAGTKLSQIVVGLQTRPISSSAPTNGQVLAWNGTQWTPTNPGSSTFTASGDLSGSNTSQTVISISGSSPILITPSTLEWTTGTSSPVLTQADNTTNSATGATMVVRAQNATGTTAVGGSLGLSSGTGTSTAGNVNIETGGNTVLSVQPTLVALAQPTFQFSTAVSSPKLKQADNTTNSATGQTLTIQAQNATGTTANGGQLNLTSGTGTTAAGNLVLQTGGTAQFTIGPSLTTLNSQEFDSTVDSKGTARDVQPKHVITTDSTVTTLDSFTIPNDSTMIVSSAISAITNDYTNGGAFSLTAAFRNNAGTVAQIGTTQSTSLLDNSSWAATIDNSGTTIRIRVTGVLATTITWSAISTRLECIS